MVGPNTKPCGTCDKQLQLFQLQVANGQLENVFEKGTNLSVSVSQVTVLV